ncbi:conserved oligomeric Golgi complex subunit 7 [Ostrinia furnacalis]|uniref:conserved oligomeric Golgi complex subunit 7 n=1 Tax=Ostrinia furnacalis TaxID=93504 RepID=UPI0010407F1F|nr:conserved oligomeric Golgi complex subunit 7 [Ostrinia furnacalis]
MAHAAKLSSLRAEAYPSLAALRRTKDQLRALARAVLRRPVEAQLDKIPQLPVWNNNDALSTDLPDFALSPQEYITEIGQYLMTLPQHLEMHLSEKQAPWQFLSEVCTHTCEVYAEKILNIRNMDALGTKRCLTDIAYLSSVVEDLGSSITPALKNLEKSLRAAAPSQAE